MMSLTLFPASTLTFVFLHPHALKLSQELAERDHATARWIGKDAAKELESAKLRERLAL